jgi:hypothetical protein
VDVIRDENHPELNTSWTDPAELTWHLYRHHGFEIARLTDIDVAALWDLHAQQHEAS